MLGSPLIRLQCFEGITASQALYEWNYPRQLLDIRLAEARGAALSGESLFSRQYLVSRPLLQALEHPGPMPAVLLIDEVDRADEEFEAFLLEMLAEGAITIPELGTIRAVVPPVVVLTSNRTRDLHDALKRRCLYHWIDYPRAELTTRILQRRVPEVPPELAKQISVAVERLRGLDLQKPPGLAESIDWARAAQLLGIASLSAEAASQTLGSVLKYREDQEVAHTRGLAWITAN
jgi:MoxR-like ATPase